AALIAELARDDSPVVFHHVDRILAVRRRRRADRRRTLLVVRDRRALLPHACGCRVAYGSQQGARHAETAPAPTAARPSTVREMPRADRRRRAQVDRPRCIAHAPPRSLRSYLWYDSLR